jgi:hypothetical protein
MQTSLCFYVSMSFLLRSSTILLYYILLGIVHLGLVRVGVIRVGLGLGLEVRVRVRNEYTLLLLLTRLVGWLVGSRVLFGLRDLCRTVLQSS